MGSNLALSGVVSNFDWSSIVDKLIAADAQPLQLLQNKDNDLQTLANAWTDINGRLLSLQNRAADLTQSANLYKAIATSSDPTVLAATTTGQVGAGSYSITVGALAQGDIVTSDAISTDPATALGKSGSMQINGITIQVAAADSLNAIRDNINAASGTGVSASVVQVTTAVGGTPASYKLVLSSNSAGATAGAINFSDAGNILSASGTGTKVQTAQDASITVNGLVVQQASNTLAGVIPNLSLTLKQPGTVTVTTGVDYDAVVKTVHDFVDQYNSVMDFINQQASWDPKTKKAGVLFGDPTVAELKSHIRSLVTGSVPGAGYNNLAAIGIDTGKWGSVDFGKLTVDDIKLRNALTQNLDAVGQVFGVNEANVALAKAGAKATADAGNTYPGMDPNNVINGTTSSANWGQPGVGWTDNTQGTFPDQLIINFGTTRTIDKVALYTLDSTTYPASQYGISDFTIEYTADNGQTWRSIAAVTGNKQGLVTANLLAPVTAQQLRVTVTGANSSGTPATDGYSRIVQVQAFQGGLGVASRLQNYLKSYTTITTGVLDLKQQSLKKQMDDIGKSMQTMTEQLKMRQNTLRQQFIAMESAMSSLKSQSQALTSLLGNTTSSQ
ncbi:MAG: flagellar filament capping protein FliD [Symbiobacteriia bacterium]